MAIRNLITRGYGAGATIAFVVTRGYSFGVGAPSVDIGALSLSELQVTDGGQVITITLSNDTWQAAGTAFNQVRQIILAGMSSAQFENTGWNKQVRDKQPITAVVRTSNTVVTVTLTAAPDYDITVAETITVTVPAEVLVTSITPLVAPSTIGITADAAVADSHFVLFRSVSRSASFSSESFQGATFRSVSNTTIDIVDTPQPLGFLLTEDGGILLQENDLPIALE